MAMTDFVIITRSMRARRFSTMLTALSVAVAVALLLTLLMMKDAGRAAFERGTGNVHMVVGRDGTPLQSLLNSVYYAGIPRNPIRWAEFEKLRDAHAPEIPMPPGIQPGFAIPIQLGDSFKGLPVVATTEAFFTRFEPVAGRPFEFASGEKFKENFQAVLGSRASRDTGLRVGDKFHVTHGSGLDGHVHDEFEFTVVGVLKDTGSAHDRAIFTNLNSSWLLHALDRLEREHGHDHGHEGHEHGPDGECLHGPEISEADLTDADRLITGVLLRTPTREGRDASAAMATVFTSLRSDTSLTVAQPSQEINRLFTIVGAVDKVLIAMAAVVLAGSGVSILLAMYGSMDLRRRQVAILRVLGCSKGRIFSLVLTEAALIGVIGSALGIALAFAAGPLIALVMRRQLGLFIDPVLPPDLTLLTMVGVIVLAALAGLLPAVMAYRTPVANNLKPLG